jgi:hypothetical protein
MQEDPAPLALSSTTRVDSFQACVHATVLLAGMRCAKRMMRRFVVGEKYLIVPVTATTKNRKRGMKEKISLIQHVILNLFVCKDKKTAIEKRLTASDALASHQPTFP